MIVELERIFGWRSAQVAISAIDFRRALGVASRAVGMVLFDQPFVGAVHGRVVGAHIFYHWAGEWGQPAIFTKAYAASEPNALALRNAALAAEVATGGESRSVAEAIDKIPGAEEIKLAPSMRGDKRVAVRFNLVARNASGAAAHEDYVKKFEASDNLKWSLSSETAAAGEKPLGKAGEAAQPGTAIAAAHP